MQLAEDDWETVHLSKSFGESHDQSLPLHHDDVILKAMPAQVNPLHDNGSEMEEKVCFVVYGSIYMYML